MTQRSRPSSHMPERAVHHSASAKTAAECLRQWDRALCPAAAPQAVHKTPLFAAPIPLKKAVLAQPDDNTMTPHCSADAATTFAAGSLSSSPFAPTFAKNQLSVPLFHQLPRSLCLSKLIITRFDIIRYVLENIFQKSRPDTHYGRPSPIH